MDCMARKIAGLDGMPGKQLEKKHTQKLLTTVNSSFDANFRQADLIFFAKTN